MCAHLSNDLAYHNLAKDLPLGMLGLVKTTCGLTPLMVQNCARHPLKSKRAPTLSRQQYNNSDGTTTVAQLTEEAAMLCCRCIGLAPADTTATTDSHVPNTSQQCSEDHDNEPQQLTKWVMRCTHEGM